MIYSPDKNGIIDHTAFSIIKDLDVDVDIVIVSFTDNYKFNPELLNLKKWVLVDYCEYGANDWDRIDTHIWGLNSYKFKRAQKYEWDKFDEFVRHNPPIVYFKRELLNKDFKYNIYPIEYPNLNQSIPVQSKEEFNNRPINVFHCWGWSHESRRVLHGNIFLNAAKKGYAVVDKFSEIESAIKEYSNYHNLWASINVPHFARIAMNEVFGFQGMSKLSISLPGAGFKCFRTAEAPSNSVMVQQQNNLAWSYEWVGGKNCIEIPMQSDMDSIRGLKNGFDTIETIELALQNPNLYDIYLNGVENIKNYRIDNYLTKYLKPTIEKHL